MQIAYVLPRPELGGGIKVALLHAHALARRGHRVTLLGEGLPPEWFPLRIPYLDLTAGPPGLDRQDLVIATFWTTVRRAEELALGPIAHFCQGYEGHLEHLDSVRTEIEAAYAKPLPTLVVSPHLQPFLAERFGRRSRVAPPMLDPSFRRRAPWLRRSPRREPWIVVPGIFEAPVKGVATALEAVSLLRQQGVPARLLRVSVLPLGEAERRILEPDRYLRHAPPVEVARATRRADLLLLPSQAGEGFGLPALEAMSLGVPVVASDIPPVRAFAAASVRLVPPGEAVAFAAAAADLLGSPSAWRAARRRGIATAERFDPARVVVQLEEAVRWARHEAAAPVATR